MGSCLSVVTGPSSDSSRTQGGATQAQNDSATRIQNAYRARAARQLAYRLRQKINELERELARPR